MSNNARRLLGTMVAFVAIVGSGRHQTRAASDDGDNLAQSLTLDGQELAAGVDWDQRPHYALWAGLVPDDGRVGALMRASLPVGADTETVHLRWFPGAAADDATLSGVTVDGVAVEPLVDGSIVTIALEPGHGDVIDVIAVFNFVAKEFTATEVDPMSSGDALQPSDIGLLARSADALMLGHWFPIWVPEGLSADAVLDGYGDISNFSAATIVAQLDVPEGSVVVTSGSRFDESAGDAGHTLITEGGVGLRDLAVVVMPDAEQVTAQAGDVEIVVSAPPGTPDVDVVADIAATSIDTLSEELGVYPWAQLDVLSAPLGSGVGGMEWPGMVWIETSVFAGGVPGLGDLGDLGDLNEIFGTDGTGLALDDLGLDSLGLDDLGLGDIGLMIETIREWTIAHEVGHMWWHSLVGNDSNTAPVVDEALAQHSACLVERVLRPDDAAAVCDINTAGQYQQLVSLMGIQDDAADQATDEFDSSLQYGALVYAKAPVFYRTLEEQYGVDETTAALATVVTDNAFGQITSDQLRDELGVALGDPAGVTELWQRWMNEAHGAEDLGE